MIHRTFTHIKMVVHSMVVHSSCRFSYRILCLWGKLLLLVMHWVHHTLLSTFTM